MAMVAGVLSQRVGKMCYAKFPENDYDNNTVPFKQSGQINR